MDVIHKKVNNVKLCTLPVYGESFIQTELVVIIGVSGRTDLAMWSPCRSHGAATVRFGNRAQLRCSCGASAADRLQETVAHSSI